MLALPRGTGNFAKSRRLPKCATGGRAGSISRPASPSARGMATALSSPASSFVAPRALAQPRSARGAAQGRAAAALRTPIVSASTLEEAATLVKAACRTRNREAYPPSSVNAALATLTAAASPRRAGCPLRLRGGAGARGA